MIEIFTILHGYYDNINNISLLTHVDIATRGNTYIFYQSSVKYDLIKHFFTNKVVLLWNSLPDFVCNSDAINCFNSRLYKCWTIQDVQYNYEGDFTGTGCRSLCSSQRFV